MDDLKNHISVEELKAHGVLKQYRVTLEAIALGRYFENALKAMASKADIKGFRKGHVPIEHIKQRYGDEIMRDVISDLIAKTSTLALKDRGLDIVSQPEAFLENDVKKLLGGADLVYKMNIELMPDIKMIDISSLELERWRITIEDKDINAALAAMAQHNRIFEKESVERPSQNEDMVVIDLIGKINGADFANNESKDMRVQIGKGQLHKNLENALIGKKAGEQFSVPMGFPADHPNKTLAGQLADFHVHLKAVHPQREIKIDDEFAQALSADNVAGLRDKIRLEMERSDKEMIKSHLKQQISQKIISLSFELPPSLLAKEREQMTQQIEQMRQNLPPEKQAEFEADKIKIENNIRKMAENRVKVALMLTRLARDFKVEISKDELRNAVESDIRANPAKAEQLRTIYQERPEVLQRLHAQLMEDKTIDKIIEKAKVKDKDIDRKDLYNDDKQSLTQNQA